MNSQRESSFPSPLAGEGGPRRRRGTGEGARNLTKAARQLRSRMTELMDRRFNTFKFRRQVPVGPYIAHFLCFEPRLAVEVDGGQHNDSARDAERDAWLARNAFRVVRFWNNDVLQNLEGVLTTLEAELNKTRHPSSSLRSTPPSPARGEGKKRNGA